MVDGNNISWTVEAQKLQSQVTIELIPSVESFPWNPQKLTKRPVETGTPVPCRWWFQARYSDPEMAMFYSPRYRTESVAQLNNPSH